MNKTQTNQPTNTDKVRIDELDLDRIDEEQSFIVTNDGVVDEDLTLIVEKVTPRSFLRLTLRRALSHVQARLSAFSKEVATQARLQFFDLVYHTHYARIRRELRREVKKERICKETGIYDLLRVTGHRV